MIKKVSEFLEMKTALENCLKLTDPKGKAVNLSNFYIECSVNIRRIDKALEELKTAKEAYKLVQSGNYSEFEKARIELINVHCERFETGEPIVVGGNYTIKQTDKQQFEAEYKNLEEVHKKAISDLEKADEVIKVILKEDADLVLITIEVEDVPSDFPGDYFLALYDLLNIIEK